MEEHLVTKTLTPTVLGIVFIVCVGCASKRVFLGGPSGDPYDPGRPFRHGIWFNATNSKSATPVNLTPQAVERGRIIYEKNCMSCHGKQGKGDGHRAADLKAKPANLQALAGMFPTATFSAQIGEGKGEEMPVWRDLLSKKEMADLSQYLHSLHKQPRER